MAVSGDRRAHQEQAEAAPPVEPQSAAPVEIKIDGLCKRFGAAHRGKSSFALLALACRRLVLRI
jgi:hypothetical protein